jgi:tRNA-dihydrouridine synthase
LKKQPQDLYRELEKGFFLSSMMGVTDGAFCAQRSQGCAMVQLGAYLAEPAASPEEHGRDARSFLPAAPQACADFLAGECRVARGSSGVATCLNLATLRLEWGLEAAERFGQAGGGLVELNVHGGYRRYVEQGKLRAMVLPEHQDELFRWVEALAGLEVPLIVKFNAQYQRTALLHVLERMAALGVFGMHLNVRDEATRQPDVAFIHSTRERYPGFLLISGYVRSAADAWAAFEAGADMVGIAAPAIEDATYVRRIAEAFRAEHG